MNKLSLFTLIVSREDGKRWQVYLNECGLTTLFSFPCLGTAGHGRLEKLGLQSNDKTLFFATVPHKKVKALLRDCVNDMGLNMAGAGIAMISPLEAVGGQTALDTLLGRQDFDPSEVSEMDFSVYPYSLVVAIAEKGHVDEVMEAARSAGAGGGTVIHAKGTAAQEARKFLGLSLVTEKEMVLIVLQQENRRAVMKAIMDQAGVHPPAHTVLFSLPVEDIAGLKSIMKEA